jgi:hypothetical protein
VKGVRQALTVQAARACGSAEGSRGDAAPAPAAGLDGDDAGDPTSRATSSQDGMNLLVRAYRDVNTPGGLMEWPHAMHGPVSLGDAQISSRGVRRKPYSPGICPAGLA